MKLGRVAMSLSGFKLGLKVSLIYLQKSWKVVQMKEEMWERYTIRHAFQVEMKMKKKKQLCNT